MKKRIRSLVHQCKQEIKVYKRILADKRTPWLAQALLGGVITYALSPVDLIPDFIPVLGHLDDIIIVPLMIRFAIRLLPRYVVADARAAVYETGEKSSNQSLQPTCGQTAPASAELNVGQRKVTQ